MPPRADHSSHAAPLSTLSIDLLRLSAPHADTAAWRRLVLAACGQYDAAQIEHGMRQLTDRGLISETGSPRTGWLTVQGRRALEEQQAPALVERTFTPPPAPTEGHPPFKDFERQTRRAYWMGVLASSRGTVAQAAAIAGCKRATVYKQLSTLGLKARDFKRPSA